MINSVLENSISNVKITPEYIKTMSNQNISRLFGTVAFAAMFLLRNTDNLDNPEAVNSIQHFIAWASTYIAPVLSVGLLSNLSYSIGKHMVIKEIFYSKANDIAVNDGLDEREKSNQIKNLLAENYGMMSEFESGVSKIPKTDSRYRAFNRALNSFNKGERII